MSDLDKLFENNRKWAQEQLKSDPLFFKRLSELQTPKHLIGDVQDLANINLPGAGGKQVLLGDTADIERKTTPVVANHNNIQPTFNVRADVQGTEP